MKKMILEICCAVSIVAGTSSCSLNIPPPDLYSDPHAITNVQTARSLLTSCYHLYPHYEFEYSLLGNDFCMTNLTAKDINKQNIYLWQDINISSFASESWLAYYNCIANIDVLQERLKNIKTSSATDSIALQAISAESNTLKAMCYFDLLRLFSNPYDINPISHGIVLKSVVGVEMKARASKKECATYIRQLLTDASKIQNAPNRNGWLSQKAAIYMLSELALYEGNYQEAAHHAQQLIATTDESLIDGSNYYRLWANNSDDVRIFGFHINRAIFTEIEFSSTEGDLYAINHELQFDANDARKAWTVFPKTMAGAERLLLGKYNKINKTGSNTMYLNRMRYAGAYFIAAECYARLNEKEKALATINRYLRAINAREIAATITGEELVHAILHEKYKEYVGEGQNYFDLKRTHTDNLKKQGIWGNTSKTTIDKNDYRWTFPIPASEFRYNEQITQNNGWPINR